MRIMLDHQDFKDLIEGRVVKRKEGNESVQIALKDIGFLYMKGLIENLIYLRDTGHRFETEPFGES